MEIPQWFIPSFYGDIRLERITNDKTLVVAEKLSTTEVDAMRKLTAHAVKKKWFASGSGLEVGARHELEARIDDVAKALSKILKPSKATISVVKTLGGRVEEIQSWKVSAPDQGDPYRTPAPSPAAQEPTTALVKPEPKAEAAVTVAKPTQGCPAPEFAKAELRARRVLDVFLTDEQREDFAKYNRFISFGAFTGHRYMITSRHANDSLSVYQRTLYDLDEECPYCVHDWSVPAAEEMLAIHLMLQMEEHEPYLRHME